ncbi:hypothetical protein M9H77_06016 [Catharanthus roseus]|uniref:Uncharacterized protein n=1 Tax=Catharanthus roseus TaxID=4058 RepID=A0ACC0BQZ0_CATRO|nr:hypothetical protein M9H77_06016 [Catharanthus roseus]
MAITMILFLAISFILQGAFGELVCEELPIGMCSFAISSGGNRCSLETYTSRRDGSTKLQCKTSQILVDEIKEHIESDECINACGLERYSIGISSDTLLDSAFALKICSNDCSKNCPNIADLYHNLAQAEGVNLPELCKALLNSPRRALSKVISSSGAAAASSGSESAPAAGATFGPAGSPVGAPAPM